MIWDGILKIERQLSFQVKRSLIRTFLMAGLTTSLTFARKSKFFSSENKADVLLCCEHFSFYGKSKLCFLDGRIDAIKDPNSL